MKELQVGIPSGDIPERIPPHGTREAPVSSAPAPSLPVSSASGYAPSGYVPAAPTAPVPFPFPLIPLGDVHPSGCDEGCDFPLHLSPVGIAVLSSYGIPDALVREALAGELQTHAHGRIYPDASPRRGWSSRVESVLSSMGVPVAAIESAREAIQGKSSRASGRHARTAQARADQIKAWKTANKAKVAEHSRLYRQRKKGLPVE